VTLRIRCPAWAAGPLRFTINGRPVADPGTPGTYAEVRYDWRTGDRVMIHIPMAVRTEPMLGRPDEIAFLYGPAVLAGDLGPAPQGASVLYTVNQKANIKQAPAAVPELLRGPTSLESTVRRSSFGLAFTARAVNGQIIVFRPFWQLPYDRYSVYWQVAPAPAGG
jgi:DUF1680 family protein